MNPFLRFALIAVPIALTACTPKPETFVPQIQRESQEFLKAISSSNVEETQKRLLPSVSKEISDLIKLAIKQGDQGITELPSDKEIVEVMLAQRNTPFSRNSFVTHSVELLHYHA